MKKAQTGQHWFFVDESGDPTFYDEAGNLIVGQTGCSPILLLGFVEMSDPQASPDRELMGQWADTWRRAAPELDEVRRREIESANTQEAIRQLFGTGESFHDPFPQANSGLVEQQAWFARLRAANQRP